MDEEKNGTNEIKQENETIKANETEKMETIETVAADKTSETEKVSQTNAKDKNVLSETNQNGVRFYSMEQKKSNKKVKKGIKIFGIILAVFIGIAIIASISDGGLTTSSSSSNSYPSDPYIAKINVEGTISSENAANYFGTPVGYQHQWTLDTIDDLIYDKNNKGLIIFVNSPGGGVYESDELYFKIREYQDLTGRPVYSAMGTMAASGGYYISAPCDKIIANRNCWTGSIGVTLGTLYDFSGLLEKYGVKTNTITSGANKAMGSSVQPMTEEQKQIFQSLVDEAYNQFVELVAEGRHLNIEKVRKIADGRIYTAKQALALGLIDEIGTFDEAVADMQKSYNLDDCEVTDLYCDDTTSVFGSLFGKINIPKMTSNGDVAAIMELMEESNEFPVSYMCEPLNKKH